MLHRLKKRYQPAIVTGQYSKGPLFQSSARLGMG